MFRLIKLIYRSLKKILSGVISIIVGVATLVILYFIAYKILAIFGIMLPWF